MARRRKSDSEGGVSLDSLMDALTNVVAVLILVLILVQADVSRTVQKLMDDLKPATPEEVQQAREDLAKLETQRERREEMLEAEAPKPAALEAERRKVALLEKDVGKNEELLADLKELRELEKKLRTDRDKEQAETVKLQEEIAKLEALLDSTPEKIAKPDIVTIPSSREIPPSAKIYYALVFDGRVHLIDPFTPIDLFENEFRQNKGDWIAQRIKRQGADRLLYDKNKIMKHFEGFDWRNRRGQDVSMLSRPHWNRIQIVIKPDKQKGGTTTDQLREPGSAFEQAVKALSRVRNAVLLFRVNPNSFSTYLLARPMADRANLPSGWEVSWNQQYAFQIPDLEVKPTGAPPPPPENPKPKPAGPPKLDPRLD
ncbi:conserved hypothetical protein [Haloferula helveola]|uniref:Uncharacterized protein n=1 Tax=Haloferula helveola TaxID=490095 RepID=A0ABM7RBH7_9BACT|nr:conserved hypothetical protein [Haloferula helveola]